MAFGGHGHGCTELPKVMVLQPPSCFSLLESLSSHKFHFLKAWEESTHSPTDFLAVGALLCTPKGPTISAQVLHQMPALALIVSTSVGLDHIDLAECRRRGIAVANAPGLYSQDVADAAVGLLIAVLRHVSAADRHVRQGLWPASADYPLGSTLRRKRVGIIGLGNIGLEVAARLVPFGYTVSFTSKNQKPTVSYPFYPDPAELAANSDALVVCCALTAETRHFVGREVLAKLGKHGVVVNVARGEVIDQGELVRQLVAGEIAGADLDVFEGEPSVPEELFALDNVVLSPHAAMFTRESFMDLCTLITENLEAFFSGKPLVSRFLNE